MGFFDRLLNRTFQPSTETRTVRERPGPLTAHEAWALVRPAAYRLDARPRLTFITSGLDLDPDGRSFTWEFGFDVPACRAHALLSVGPPGEADDIDEAPVVLVQRITAAAGTGRKAALPEHFRDSPEVVSEFEAGGVDFVAGPSDMKLEARVLPTGEPAWVTYYWDEERSVQFGSDR
jgi:hypothetical protein